METHLRPLTVGEILDRTANLYRAHFLKFVGIAAPPAAVLLGCMSVVVLLVRMNPGGQRDAAAGLVLGLGMVGAALIAMPLYLGASAMSSAALSHAASAASMDEAISIRGSYRAVWKKGWRYVGLYLLQWLAIMAGPVVVWMIAAAVLASMTAIARQAGPASGVAAAVFILLLGAVLAVFAIWMVLVLSMAFPASVVEDLGPGTALKRAANLSRGTRWRILVLYLLGAAASYIITIVLITPMFFLALIPGMKTPENVQLMATILMVVFYGISFAVQALTKPIYGIAVVLFYYDQRVRKEGFDIELLMREAGMVGEPAAAADAALPVTQPEIETAGEAPPGLDPPYSTDPQAEPR